MWVYFDDKATNLEDARQIVVKPNEDKFEIELLTKNGDKFVLGIYETEDAAQYAYNELLEMLPFDVSDMPTDTDYKRFVDEAEREAKAADEIRKIEKHIADCKRKSADYRRAQMEAETDLAKQIENFLFR